VVIQRNHKNKRFNSIVKLKMDTQILYIAEKGGPEEKRMLNYLRRKGITVLTAHRANDAYTLLKSHPVSVIIAEYNIPKSNPLKFLTTVKKIKPHVEVIFLSAKATLTKAIEAMKAGAYDFYESPVNMRLLMAVIEKAMEKQVIHLDKIELEKKVKARFNIGKIVGRSKEMQHVISIVNSVAPKHANILLTGETGTGKEMIAQAVHYNSLRASKPLISVNCAALSDGVLESELFGHERGAFTGAITRRVGRFELADGGTLFLDEVGDMPYSTQVKLLRVLQEKSFERVGGNENISVDVRIIAATNQNLKNLILEGRFREDLYYRLNVVHIQLPTLQQRKDDMPLLVSTFIQKFNEEKGYHIKGITKAAMQILLNYKWPGNVRELENAIESAMALSTKDVIDANYLPSFLLMTEPQDIDFFQLSQNMTLYEMEREIIGQTLLKTGGNKSRAAKILGIGLRTLQRKTKDS